MSRRSVGSVSVPSRWQTQATDQMGMNMRRRKRMDTMPLNFPVRMTMGKGLAHSAP